jgi:hypothetical protein
LTKKRFIISGTIIIGLILIVIVENQMKLKYEPGNGDTQSIAIIGYFEKGYSGNVTVKISPKDGGGFLVFDVDENIN